MATITSTIKLVDQMTPTLNKISKAVDNINSKVNKLGNQPAMTKLETKFSRLTSTTQKFGSTANTAFNNVSKGANKATNFTRKLYYALRNTAMFLGLSQGIKGFADVADTMMNATARLNLVNDGLYTTSEYLDIIYEAAQRSRGSFTDMVSSVSKLGVVAGDAFGSVNEMVAFTELMNKLFVIASASSAESSNAAYQLTQAMAAGKLQGDEMKSILENAPLLAQKVADKLGVARGEVKALGAEGVITADIIKEALFDSADEIEEEFEKMPKTIGQTWTEISNYAINAFRPVIERIQKFLNSPTFEKIKNKLFSILTAIADGIIYIIDLFESPRIQNAISKITDSIGVLWDTVRDFGRIMRDVGIWICDRWETVGNFVYMVIAWYLAFKAVMLAVSAASIVANIAMGLASFSSGLMAGSGWAWTLLILITLIGIIYIGVAAWNKLTDSTLSATGVMFGFFAALIAIAWDAIIFLTDVFWTILNIAGYIGALLWQIFIDVIDFIFLIFRNVGAFIGNVFAALVVMAIELGKNIWGTFLWLKDVIATWGSNIMTGMSQLCDALPYYWEAFKWGVIEKFWGIISGAINAFNDLIQASRDVCVKMLTPFADFANGVKNIFNSIKRLWNGIADRLSMGVDVPDWLKAAGSALGLTIGDRIGLSVGRFEIDDTPITADGWINAVDGLANTAESKELSALTHKLWYQGNAPEVNWSTNELPSYSDYADWEGMEAAIQDAWSTFEYTNPFDAFNGDDYKADWDGLVERLGNIWDSTQYKNPIDAYNYWYKNGKAVADEIDGIVEVIGGLLDGIGGLFGGSNDDPNFVPYYDPVLGTVVGQDGLPLSDNLPKSLEDLLGNTSGLGDTLGAIADNTGKAAGSAGNIEDTLDLAEEELELLRSLAEQEVINRFTTAEIHVDMTNNNNVSSNMDLDGIVTHLSEKLYEELGVVANGVHY